MELIVSSSPCVKLIIPGRLEFLRVVDKVSESVSQHMGFGDDERDAIGISVIEACTNAIEHGCRSDETKIVTISYGIEGDVLRITVVDPGSGFDPGGIGCDLENRVEHRGRGFAIIKSLMDEVLFEFQHGTSVIMVKRLVSRKKEAEA